MMERAMLDSRMHYFAVALGAMVTVFAGGAQAASDYCAGGLAAARIVECLKPESMGTQTRGIRVPQGKPGTAAAPAQHATVNLLVPFAYDSADLTAQGMTALDAVITALKDPSLASVRFELAGHTDAVGADDYNLKLSQRRADTARAYLLDKGGIAPERVTAVGYGRSRLYDTRSPGAAVNRRVQLTRLD
jgi:outer membrane protein OmpA-like peptidoglycan-associated protein